MVVLVIELVLEVRTVRFNVAELSHPTLLTKTFVCVPAVVKVKPFQVYGKPIGQIVIFVVELLVAFTVRLSVAELSQPPAVVI